MTQGLELMSSFAAGKSRIPLRQSLPIQSTAIVERYLGDGRFMVSDADAPMPLKLLQRELNDEFSKFSMDDSIDMPGDKIKAGELYLYRDENLEVFRARVLQVGDSVSCRLIDFGLCVVTGKENFFSFDHVNFDCFRDLPQFITRVNLPSHKELLSLGLPTADTIKEGDVVEMIIFTTTEPHLAVFGFVLSYRFMPAKFTDGLDAQGRNNWSSLFTDSMLVGPIIARHGFGKLHNHDFHVNRLALVAYAKTLDKVYVQDLDSLIRIVFLRERLEIIYGNGRNKAQFSIEDLSELSVGSGCVAYHEKQKIYVRVEVVSMGSKNVEVAPIDMPNLGSFSVGEDSIFKLPQSLQFARQCFSVRMTRHSDGQIRHYLSGLVRCVLPDKTAVILNSEMKFGLVSIHCSNAAKGVLSKIGFVSLMQNKFDAEPGTTREAGFGQARTVVAAKLEDITRFAEQTSAPKDNGAASTSTMRFQRD